MLKPFTLKYFREFFFFWRRGKMVPCFFFWPLYLYERPVIGLLFRVRHLCVSKKLFVGDRVPPLIRTLVNSPPLFQSCLSHTTTQSHRCTVTQVDNQTTGPAGRVCVQQNLGTGGAAQSNKDRPHTRCRSAGQYAATDT